MSTHQHYIVHLAFVADTTAVFASPFPRNQENRYDFSFAPEHREIFPTPRMQGGERGGSKAAPACCVLNWSRTRAGVREREGGGILVIAEYGRQRFRSLGLIVISGMKINEQCTLKIDFIKRC